MIKLNHLWKTGLSILELETAKEVEDTRALIKIKTYQTRIISVWLSRTEPQTAYEGEDT